MTPLLDFVLANLPPAPARVLEVGCGEGDLARALAAAGYDVLAIDPRAPEGPIFRQIALEELDDAERFDAVVASRVFHHLRALDESLARVARMLDGGPLVLDEFAWDWLDDTTASWYESQRRILLAAGREPRGPSAHEWEHHHRGRHAVQGAATLRGAVERHFVGEFEEVPYLWRYLGGEASLELEEALIAAGAIRPIGFRFVGIPRGAATLGT